MFFELLAEGFPVYTQDVSRAGLVAPDTGHYIADVFRLYFNQRPVQRLVVERGGPHQRGQIRNIYRFFLRHDHQALDSILQLAHISRPGIVPEYVKSLV